jgi:hypothetical protein
VLETMENKKMIEDDYSQMLLWQIDAINSHAPWLVIFPFRFLWFKMLHCGPLVSCMEDLFGNDVRCEMATIKTFMELL